MKFIMPFDEYRSPAVAGDIDTYQGYLRRSIEFIEARNLRISSWAVGALSGHPEVRGDLTN